MIDLHLHLDGSLSREDFVYLSKKQHIALGKEFPNNISAKEKCGSLEEYLKSFELPLSLLQTPESLEYVTISLLDRLYALGYVYAEIRFAPLLHTQKGLSQTKVVDCVVEGLYKALENRKNFDANIILCCMRDATDEQNKETVKVALEFRNEKVVALDLAGNEKARSLNHFNKIFEPAFKSGFPVITHAGESTGCKEVYDAINYDDKILVEEVVQNMVELNCSVLGSTSYQEASVIEQVMGKDEILSLTSPLNISLNVV